MLPLHSTHSVNQLMTNCKSSNTTAGKAAVRPSSPRQFFARLYGHLEPGNNETESTGDVLSKVNSLNMSENDDNNNNNNNNNNKSLPSTSNNNNVNYQSDGSSTSSSDLYLSDKRVDGSYQPHNVLSDKTQEVPRDESNNTINAFKFGSSILLKTISRALSELPSSNFTKV
uniref:Uncharacterized protein n=1 Tax=Glossina austeni TaxID=7395 RepID=A0A1A9VPP9_GLOAU